MWRDLRESFPGIRIQGFGIAVLVCAVSTNDLPCHGVRKWFAQNTRLPTPMQIKSGIKPIGGI